MSVVTEPVGRLRRWLPRGRAEATATEATATEATASAAGAGAAPAGRLGAVLALAPPIDVDGPRVRLGLLWAAVTLALAAALPLALAVVLSMAAMVAAGQAVSSWRRRAVHPWRPVAVLGAPVLALSAMGGVLGPVAVIVGIVVVSAIGRRLLGQDDTWLTAAIPVACGLPAATVVLVRTEIGVAAALVLLSVAHLWDASAFVVGSGARNRWEAHLAASATVAAISLLVAAVLVPPFRGLSPAVLGAAAVLTAPLGPYLATLLLGDRRRRAPALRRLDVLVVLAPVWAFLAAVLLP